MSVMATIGTIAAILIPVLMDAGDKAANRAAEQLKGVTSYSELDTVLQQLKTKHDRRLTAALNKIDTKILNNQSLATNLPRYASLIGSKTKKLQDARDNMTAQHATITSRLYNLENDLNYNRNKAGTSKLGDVIFGKTDTLKKNMTNLSNDIDNISN